MVNLLWNNLKNRISVQQAATAMLLLLSALLILHDQAFSAAYLAAASIAIFMIHRLHFKGVVLAALSIASIALFAYFTNSQTIGLWNCFWFCSLFVAFYLLAEGESLFFEEKIQKDQALKNELENSNLWKARFETLQHQLIKEKEKISGLEQDQIVLEEKHEERVEALKQLIEIASSESARHRHRLEHLLKEREELSDQVYLLSQEIEKVKEVVKEEHKPIFSDEESLKRIDELNEFRFDNFQLRLLLTEQRKEKKIQEKVKRERAPRASAPIGQERITLQDLAKVISKNIK